VRHTTGRAARDAVTRIDRLRGHLIDRHVDVVAQAGAQSVEVCDERRPRGLNRRGFHGQRTGRQQRRQSRDPRAGQHAAKGEVHPVTADPVAIGAGLPEVGHRNNNQLRVDRQQSIRSDAQGVQPSGRQILDEDVGRGEQPMQPSTSFGAGHVHRHDPLVGVVSGVADGGVPRVAPRQRDSYDIGAQIAEITRGELRLAVGQVDHPDVR
jgi:hypothetical protein